MTERRGLAPAAAFAGLCFAWSTTFLPMKIGLDHGLPPLTFAALRVLLAAVLLGTLFAVVDERPPCGVAEWAPLIPAALAMTTVSLGLIFWGEQHTTSGVPALVIATQPLAVALLVWRLDGIRPRRGAALGLLAGLAGIALVFGDRVAAPQGIGLVAVAAMLVGSTSYVAGALYAERRLAAVPVFRLVFAQMAAGGLGLALAALVLEGPSGIGALADPLAAAAVAYLVANTCAAYLLFLWLVKRIGASRASLYAFITPVGTLLLGGLAYAEPVGLPLILGALLILAGLALLRGRALPRG